MLTQGSDFKRLVIVQDHRTFDKNEFAMFYPEIVGAMMPSNDLALQWCRRVVYPPDITHRLFGDWSECAAHHDQGPY